VTVAVIDSGHEMSEEPVPAAAPTGLTLQPWNGLRAHPYDDYGHGTARRTLISAAARSRSGMTRYENVQADPAQARTVPGDPPPKGAHRQPRVADGLTAGLDHLVQRALEFAIEHQRTSSRVDVINLSLGHPIYESPETVRWSARTMMRSRRIVVRRIGRQLRINEETGAVGYAGSRRPATRLSRSPSVQSTRTRTAGSRRRHRVL
jgi:hypothetical protein